MTDTSLSLTPAQDGVPAFAREDARVGDYMALLKPRVVSLVVFTGFAGLFVAPGTLHPLLAAVAVLCIAMGAGGAGAINMWYDHDIDAIMERTRRRPIPSGRVEPAEALTFGIILSLFSVMLMGLALNWAAAGLLAFANAFYVFVYTIWLKRRTPFNIVIGGAAGAFPPMIGWAAATGTVGIEAIALFAIIFMWTPPHFWALALYRTGDYAAAGIPMLPVTAGPAVTRRQIVLYSIILVPLTLAPVALGFAGWLYGTIAGLFGLAFLTLAFKVWRETGTRAARRLFGFSILYLFVLFSALIAERALAGPIAGIWG